MKIFAIADQHVDARRDVTSWNPGDSDGPRATPQEYVLLTVKHEGVTLGNHSHPYIETFILVKGSCTLRTWTKEDEHQETRLNGPTMFEFAPYEEHVLMDCSADMVLIGLSPRKFNPDNLIPAQHL